MKVDGRSEGWNMEHSEVMVGLREVMKEQKGEDLNNFLSRRRR